MKHILCSFEQFCVQVSFVETCIDINLFLLGARFAQELAFYLYRTSNRIITRSYNDGFYGLVLTPIIPSKD